MRVLDLFSGIGGFSLGLERAGMRTVAFCEINPYCRRVLAKHWPSVPCYDDVTTLTAARLAADGIIEINGVADTTGNDVSWRRHSGTDQQDTKCRTPNTAISIDVICGGFPCQDISLAGKGAGIAGERSGLWSEYARIIGEVRPRYAIVENVAALLGRGIERVLGDLAALGFDAEWHCIPASAVGAPHRRDRVWIIADARQTRLAQRQEHQLLGQCAAIKRNGWWLLEPDMGRVADGVPQRVDRLKALGNAVVPQIPELIGRAIMQNGGA